MSLSPEIFVFLRELSANNNREWFAENKKRFKELEGEIKLFLSRWEELMNRHDSVEGAKLFRIYRDVRFSADKTPYKTHFALSISRKGEERRGGYYMRIAPGETFLAAGFWNPNKEDLFRIRKEWEMDAGPLRAILRDAGFRKYWGDLQGEQLKRPPKGFHADDPNIDLIRYKQFLFTASFGNEEVLADDWLEKADRYYRSIRPFFDLMSEILTTNLDGESVLPG